MKKLIPAVVTVLAVAGCTHLVDGTPKMAAPGYHVPTAAAPTTGPVALPGPPDCPEVPFTVLLTQSPDEPTLSIPTVLGWQPSNERNSPLIRGAFVAPGLRANDFTPNAVVTLADVTKNSDTPEKAIQTETQGLDTKFAIDSLTTGTRCGFPYETVDYKYEGRPATTLIVAAKDDKARVWVSTVEMQTTEPNRPEYVKAKQLIIGAYKVTTKGGAAR